MVCKVSLQEVKGVLQEVGMWDTSFEADRSAWNLAQLLAGSWTMGRSLPSSSLSFLLSKVGLIALGS